MNGYLQRTAASAIKPGECIQPVLGSVFSPANYATPLEALSIETAQPVIRPGSPESKPQVHPRASLSDPRADALPGHEPSPKGHHLAGLGETPIATSKRLFTALVPRASEKAETLIAPRTLAKSGDEGQEGGVKRARETREEEPLPQTNELPTAETQPAQSAQFVEAPIPTSNRSTLPRGSKEKAEALTAPLLLARKRDQNLEGSLNPRREATVGAAPEQKVEHQTGKIAHGKAVFSAGTATKREVDRSGAQLATTTAVAKPDFRRFVASTPATFTSGTGGKERMGSLRRGTPHEPDEIQIHIGRIEVIAVPPAPAPPAPQKPRRGAPSLDEYLRRRDGKSV